MNETVRSFDNLKGEPRLSAGGKGATLARLYQADYPVPDGFVILPSAFSGDRLTAEGWQDVKEELTRLQDGEQQVSFAVRSSAFSEDSTLVSYAGEFETVLDVHTDRMIKEAVHTVRRSRKSQRVQVYSQVKGIESSHDLAVVVQRMIQADISGVLFTADPVTGSYNQMSGNYIHGLGEKLVSGESDPYTFTISRPKGRYAGPPEIKHHAKKLYKLALRLEKELQNPQDIEWAIANGKLFLLQSRPVTTLQGYDPTTGEWNDSLRGDFFWTNVNVAEARPDVMSPLTWTLGQHLRKENQPMPGDYPFVGNISGRQYLNLSITLSMFRAIGLSPKRLVKRMENAFGPIPEGMDIPLFPFTTREFFSIIPGMIKVLRMERKITREIPDFLKSNPDWCSEMQQTIKEANDISDLYMLWFQKLLPYFIHTGFMIGGPFKAYSALVRKLQPSLTKLIGESDANTLLSNLSEDYELLASLGLVVGVSRVAKGEMSRTEYLEQFGHRGPHEMELSIPRPAEEPDWIDQRLEEFQKSPIDVDELLAKRKAENHDAWQRLVECHPRKARSLKSRLDQIPASARLREAVRSELTRVYWMVRLFALRLGELSGIGEDIFFITYEEFVDVLSGGKPPLELIPTRRNTHEMLRSLPQTPSIIRGRFDIHQWAADSNRRGDIFDAHAPIPSKVSNTLKGFAGAAGRVEGLVRRLDHFEDGDQLVPGEILVTATTNVGWTPLFPRAAAVITDVGAPLSHAAIVARELGIPAVVGCVNATTRLRTGDKVLVDGGHGIVEILNTI